MQETQLLPGPTFNNYFSREPYRRFLSISNADTSSITPGKCVNFVVQADGSVGCRNMAAGRVVCGVAIDQINAGQLGRVAVGGIMVVAAGDTTTGAQISNDSGLAVTAGVEPFDPGRYIGEALSYDAGTNTKLVVLRLG